MSHHCSALVICCMDFRLQHCIPDLALQFDIVTNHDYVAVAGGIKSLVAPAKPEYREFIMEQIRISVMLHEIGQVLIVNHLDCGAYGGKRAFASEGEERAKHTADMRAAARMIKERYPSLEVASVLAEFNENSSVDFNQV